VRKLRRVRWWVWASAGLLALAIGTGAGFLISMNTAPSLSSSEAGWLYPVDQAHAVDARADAITQTTAPVRSGQRQGIVIFVSNSSDWTQVILGPGWRGDVSPFSIEPMQVTVQTGPDLNAGGNGGRSSYVSPGAIPPHSGRFVHLTWTSDLCMGNGEAILDVIPLRVRVGVITKTEVITPVESFALRGPDRAKCG